jgi:hypothetical protein
MKSFPEVEERNGTWSWISNLLFFEEVERVERIDKKGNFLLDFAIGQ